MVVTKSMLTIVLYLLSSNNVLHKLQIKLRAALPVPLTTPSISQLEQMPYLNAVIPEGFRLGMEVGVRVLVRTPEAGSNQLGRT
jgi:hypothetical protein